MHETTSAAPPASLRTPWIGAALLVAFVVAAYAGSLAPAWLEYDDDWLVRENRVLADPSPVALVTAATDFSVPTRLALGAEYLPVRDAFVWLELRAFGPAPLPMRAVSVLLYAAACALLLGWAGRVPEVPALAVWLFALHPVHVESVAWLAGRKDQLALLFTAAALRVWAGERASLRRVLVPLLVALACGSKAMSVVVPLLFVAHDLLARRRTDRVGLLLSGAVALLAALVHARVGASVSMLAALPGGSRAAAVATMAPVFWEYVGLSLGLVRPSLVHPVPARTIADPVALLAIAGAAALALGHPEHGYYSRADLAWGARGSARSAGRRPRLTPRRAGSSSRASRPCARRWGPRHVPPSSPSAPTGP